MSANCKYLIFLSDVFEIWRDKTPGLRHIHWSLHISCQPSSTPGVSLKCFLFRNELIFPFLKYFIFFLICLLPPPPPPPPPARPPQLAWVVFLHHLSPRLQGGKGSGQQSNNSPDRSINRSWNCRQWYEWLSIYIYYVQCSSINIMTKVILIDRQNLLSTCTKFPTVHCSL